jgi:hypothetical protein
LIGQATLGHRSMDAIVAASPVRMITTPSGSFLSIGAQN